MVFFFNILELCFQSPVAIVTSALEGSVKNIPIILLMTFSTALIMSAEKY